MNHARLTSAPRWTTSSFGAEPQPSKLELSALGEHLQICRGSAGRWFALRRGVDKVHGFMAARIVTSLMAVTVLIGIGLWLS